MTDNHRARRTAVIGAGMAGARCARLLADAGHDVQVVDKARGVGGRMATRRVSGSGDGGRGWQASFDHGAPGFSARSPAFARHVQALFARGDVCLWTPPLSPRSHTPLDPAAFWVPVPDLPALCRQALDGLPLLLHREVDGLRRDADGWQLLIGGEPQSERFDHLVLALPPPQAAPLLQPHQPAWAQRAGSIAMRPCWTLMGVAELDEPPPAWDLAWPQQGPLACIQRVDRKPGRTAEPGCAHWVAQATAAWSAQHLATDHDSVQRRLLAALQDALGQAPRWRLLQLHRWLYAHAPRDASSPTERCWWDAGSGLGVCSDALGGGGVEGAWLSGSALAAAMVDTAPPARAGPAQASVA